MSRLAGARILLVEDEALVAAMLADMLEEVGATVVGPAGSITAALALAETAEIDAAVLDVNVRGERVDAVAERLRSKGIPFLFATGYGATRDDRWPEVQTVDKPYTQGAIVQALARSLAAR